MRVDTVKYEQLTKRFRLANDRTFVTHRYGCLGPGDDVVVIRKNRAHAVCENGVAQILPVYRARAALIIGGKKISVVIKEIETAEELAGYHELEKCHYRGKVLHGRRVPLIVRSNDPLLPLVLGYIELATAFIMNRPRAKILDSEFRDLASTISWTSWRKDTVRKRTNLVVRIARTVVSPEFRGLGLASVLVRHGAQFARDHWHVGGLKPLFLEITADMLRYVPFVESAGMHYIGDTEGNLARINRDMTYILKNYSRVVSREILKEESAGIVDLQVFYATNLKRIQKEHGLKREDLLNLLLKNPHRLSDDDWSMLHRIFRLPKPTFLMGLTPAVDEFVTARAKFLDIPARYPVRRPKKRRPTFRKPIEIESCSLALSSSLRRTRATRKIQQAFGVDRDSLTTNLFSNLSFSIRPGDVVLLCGPSGAGKTTLLSVLSRSIAKRGKLPKGLLGQVHTSRPLSVSTLGPLTDDRPLISALGSSDFDTALFALNVSGLAEARLYVRRYRELSNGQRYRAMVANLIASQSSVWVADEFCATLDPITANIVSRNLRRCAKELGVTVILAAANWSEFIHELQPDKIVHLRAPWDHRIFEWQEFRRAVFKSQALGRIELKTISRLGSRHRK